MTEKEMTSIGKIFVDQIDRKFDEKLKPIHNRLAGIEQRVTNIEQDVSGLKQDVSGLKQDVSSLSSRVDANSVSLMRIERSLGAWKERQDIQDETIKKIKEKVGIS